MIGHELKVSQLSVKYRNKLTFNNIVVIGGFIFDALAKRLI